MRQAETLLAEWEEVRLCSSYTQRFWLAALTDEERMLFIQENGRRIGAAVAAAVVGIVAGATQAMKDMEAFGRAASSAGRERVATPRVIDAEEGQE